MGFNRGQILKKDMLEIIANNYVITKHAKERIIERLGDENKIKNIILNPYLAYYNTDGTINIAKDEYEYLVVDYDKSIDKFSIITFKEKSNNNITIGKKRQMAIKGLERKHK